MPKFASTFKSLLTNKEKLFELAKTSLNENCSTMLLKKLPEKLRDPDKFLIPCDFSELVQCLALAHLGASINLMPLSVWKKLSLPELTDTCMTLELADRSVVKPTGLAEDVFAKVGKFYFPVDFVIVDYNVDPRGPLILGRPFLRTAHALIDVYDNSKSGNHTSDSTISSAFPSFTPFRDSDFLLEEMDDFLSLDESISPDIENGVYNSKEDILFLEKLNLEELKEIRSSTDNPPELELKDLPSHLEYAYLEGTDKFPVIIAKDLKDEEKTRLLEVLKSHKRAIAWKISNIKGIDPYFYTHKILMEDDFKPVVQHQRRVNLKIHKVIKTEVVKLLDARLIYPIFDSPWVSHVHCVPKKGDTSKFPLTRKTKRRPPSLALMGRLPTDVCISAYAMLRARSKGAENLAADHLSRLENPHQGKHEKKEINETFPIKTLGMVSSRGDSSTPWFADFANYYAGNFVVKGMSSQQKRNGVFTAKKSLISSWLAIMDPPGDIMVQTTPLRKSLIPDSISQQFIAMPTTWGINFVGPFPSSRGNKYILLAVDYLSKWVKAKALLTNDARVVVRFLKTLFARFGTPRAIVSDRGTHFCNDQFAKVMLKYGVTHRLSTAYHPQTSGQVEVSNHSLKRILERTIGLPWSVKTLVLVFLSLACLWKPDILDLID
ncbi:reverse transcriptase domain-containing protein [Tanacetum coccineum]